MTSSNTTVVFLRAVIINLFIKYDSMLQLYLPAVRLVALLLNIDVVLFVCSSLHRSISPFGECNKICYTIMIRNLPGVTLHMTPASSLPISQLVLGGY